MATRGKILVVDDDAIVLRLTRARLENAGFEVITRDEALGTSGLVLREMPDLVLMDLNMPGLSGERLSRLLRSKPDLRDIPVVFHSSEDLLALQAKGRDAGAIGVIAKTENDAIFLAHFERLFNQVQAIKHHVA